ncbi:DegQ family serine endoprotease [Candidatus Nitrospira bockiana]
MRSGPNRSSAGRWGRTETRWAAIATVFALLVILPGCNEGPTRSIEATAPPIAHAASASNPGTFPANETFISVAKVARASVVNISSSQKPAKESRERSFNPFFDDPFFRRFFGEEFERRFPVPRERREQGLGSGVIVSPDGHILTNNHVVEQADEIQVLLPDKRTFKAKVIGSDPKTDVAVIKIDASNLPVLPWGDSSQLQVGEIVLAVGNPFGLNQTVTMGIISAVGRANMGIVDYEDFIQTDAAINPGNSGGALVNLKGELVGINTAIFSRTGGNMGIGFAIPSNMARNVMNSLIKYGKVVRGWLGVSIQEVNQDLAKEFGAPDTNGALVADVLDDSPAAKAKLQRGDIITGYNGIKINDPAHLRSLVADTAPETTVTLTIWRDKQSREIKLTVGELPKDLAKASRGGGEGQGEHALAGVTVEPLSDRPGKGGRKDTGVSVVEVQPDTPADRAGLRPGDIIREIDRKPVRTVQDFERLVSQLNPKSRVLLLITRGNATVFLSINPES